MLDFEGYWREKCDLAARRGVGGRRCPKPGDPYQMKQKSNCFGSVMGQLKGRSMG